MAPIDAGETLPYCVPMLESGLQIFQVEQQQAFLIGDVKDDVEHALLHVVERQQAAH